MSNCTARPLVDQWLSLLTVKSWGKRSRYHVDCSMPFHLLMAIYSCCVPFSLFLAISASYNFSILCSVQYFSASSTVYNRAKFLSFLYTHMAFLSFPTFFLLSVNISHLNSTCNYTLDTFQLDFSFFEQRVDHFVCSDSYNLCFYSFSND